MWPRLVEFGLPVVAQRYIPGPESMIESYHVYVADGGHIAAEFTGRKIRTLPLAYGHTTALAITWTLDVARRGREVVRALGLTGVAKLDFKRAFDGSLHLLEVNPRFTLWHHAAARAGVNVPALVYADLTGGPRRPARPVRPGVRWCSPNDLFAARQDGIPLARWLPWALRCEAKQAWARDDPMPFIAAAMRWARTRARRRSRRQAGRSRRGRPPAPPTSRAPPALSGALRHRLRYPRQPLRPRSRAAAPRGTRRRQVLCAGDIVGYGAQPNECIERLVEIGAISVAGNHDLFAVDRLPARLPPFVKDSAPSGRRGRSARTPATI